jgi:hypothetical protein
MTQLSLLDWTPPQKVIAFPLSRRAAKIRTTANILMSKHGKAAEAYWRQVVKGLDAQLERAGISPAERMTELRAFFDAVQAELTRMAYASHGHPGGAA